METNSSGLSFPVSAQQIRSFPARDLVDARVDFFRRASLSREAGDGDLLGCFVRVEDDRFPTGVRESAGEFAPSVTAQDVAGVRGEDEFRDAGGAPLFRRAGGEAGEAVVPVVEEDIDLPGADEGGAVVFVFVFVFALVIGWCDEAGGEEEECG